MSYQESVCYFLTFRCKVMVSGAPGIHQESTYLGEITYFDGFGQIGSEHWKIHINLGGSYRVDLGGIWA